MDMGQSYVSCSYKYHLPWTLPRWIKMSLQMSSPTSPTAKPPRGCFCGGSWSSLPGHSRLARAAWNGFERPALLGGWNGFWRESHITEMIRHVSCKILPESWQINANYCINLFWVAEHMFHSCRVSNADAVSTERQLVVGLLRAWRLALRMSQVGLDDILDILDVHRFCCLSIKNRIIAWISWMCIQVRRSQLD